YKRERTAPLAETRVALNRPPPGDLVHSTCWASRSGSEGRVVCLSSKDSGIERPVQNLGKIDIEGKAESVHCQGKKRNNRAAPLRVGRPHRAAFAACGPAGLAALQRVLRRARALGVVTILDGKRNDIADTAVAYADAAFAGVSHGGPRLPVWDADALTINAYLG